LKHWLTLSKIIDHLSFTLAQAGSFCVLVAAVVSAGNAFVRYGFDWSSNAWLEIQWYMFAAIVMLGAPWVLKLNEHVRVDLIYGKISQRAQVWLDLLGIVFFLFPVMLLMVWLSWPLFVKMYLTGEMSSNASGLVRWPAMLLLPLGFGLMCLQGLSEVIKRIAHLRGLITLEAHYEAPLQ
jgi:TRAP-type mannitol/chloroaromatic compound transport system permease small subunit